ncbi:MAG: hypothetical protein UH854_00165, partial [Clostridia bacterium]|nr:hypothetical protein [Clostridia bacterium]
LLFSPQQTSNNIENPKKTKVINSDDIVEKQENNNAISNYYVVRSENNSVFLYDNNNLMLNKLNIDYSNLRKFDKEQFDKGIIVSEMSDVYQLIEDFSN